MRPVIRGHPFEKEASFVRCLALMRLASGVLQRGLSVWRVVAEGLENGMIMATEDPLNLLTHHLRVPRPRRSVVDTISPVKDLIRYQTASKRVQRPPHRPAEIFRTMQPRSVFGARSFASVLPPPSHDERNLRHADLATMNFPGGGAPGVGAQGATMDPVEAQVKAVGRPARCRV